MDPNDLLANAGRSRETTIVRDAEGRWFQDGDPLEHPNLTHAFDCWLERAEDGRYCLRNDINWAYVTIEGAPLFVRSVAIDDGGITLKLSDDREERLVAPSLRVGPEGALYCDVREGTMVARFDRHAMFLLEPLVGEDKEGQTLRIGGEIVRPRTVVDPLALVPQQS
ncbi:MAG: DUF1285 domain-containing protein [Sandaracinaceae bacterium]|jgi:hypothetical protein|nr:DUF1285 domain-containing protein [Sandaracinaceae bacterium]